MLTFVILPVIEPATFRRKAEVSFSVLCLTVCLSVAGHAASQGIEVLALSETWLRNDTEHLVIIELAPSCYEFKHFPRTAVQLYSLLSELKTSRLCTHFEHTDCIICA